MSSPSPDTFKVYQASAGAGKTYTIIKEYLKLCLKDKAATAEFSHILAITFTNMAANEMKEKIVRQLIDIINSDPDKDPGSMEADLIGELDLSREQLKDNAYRLFLNIIYNYSDFFICTIDSFVNKLARSFAQELDLPTQFNVSIDEQEVADDITERIGEQIGADNPYLTKIVEDFMETKLDDERKAKVDEEINTFVKNLFSEEVFDKSDANPFEMEESYRETLAFIDGKVFPFEARCQQFVKDFGTFIERHGLTPDDFQKRSMSPCLSILKYLRKGEITTPSNSLMKIVNGEDDWYQKTNPHPELNEEFEKVFLQPMRYYLDNIGSYLFYKSQRGKLSLYVLRSKLKAEMEDYIGEEQVVHISEFNKRINKILGDFSVPFIYERLGNRLKHVFIDEFQDTSVLQWQNLIPLLHNGIADGQMSMVVGDGKQSIYRWRSGEVEQIVKLPEIHLKPDEEAFDEFERSFTRSFWFKELKTNFRSFANIVKFNNEFFLSSLHFLGPEQQKVYVEDSERFNKEVSVEQVVQHEEPGYVEVELFDPDNDPNQAMLERVKELIEDLQGKGFVMSDITILVRKNKFGSLVADYLNKNGIPVVSIDSIMLKSSSKVRLIIATLDYLIHSGNPVTKATMNYYWNLVCGERFDGVADGFLEQGPDPEAFKPLMMRSYSLYDLCSALMRLYGMDVAGDTYLSFLLDVVYQWQEADENGIASFLEYWEKKKNKLTVTSGKTDAVNVMTIHKSKGLEFNVVICPFVLDNLDDRRELTLWVTPEELGFEHIPHIDKVQYKLTNKSAEWSKGTAALAAREDAMTRLDNMNLMYVAFTRAKQRLHILSYKPMEKKDKKQVVENNPINTFLASHPATYGDPDTRKVEERVKPKEALEIYHESCSGDWLHKVSVDPNPSMFWADPNDRMKPQEWGDFVHQVLSEIRHPSDIGRALRPHVDAGVIDQAKADMLASLFLQMATHPLIEAAFSSDAKVKNECDILMSTGKIVRPDRYAELPDRVILLDYKTGKRNDSYHRQLAEYMSVLGKMVSKPIEGFLVYLHDKVEVVKV